MMRMVDLLWSSLYEGVCNGFERKEFKHAEIRICMDDSRYFPLVVGVVGIQGFSSFNAADASFLFSFFVLVMIADDGCHR